MMRLIARSARERLSDMTQKAITRGAVFAGKMLPQDGTENHIRLSKSLAHAFIIQQGGAGCQELTYLK
jgi:hypothetical protein